MPRHLGHTSLSLDFVSALVCYLADSSRKEPSIRGLEFWFISIEIYASDSSISLQNWPGI